ncbi:MAG: hypothetical protein RL563_403 [Pseudomonadota bacterium]|jgi:hypothetical protein
MTLAHQDTPHSPLHPIADAMNHLHQPDGLFLHLINR